MRHYLITGGLGSLGAVLSRALVGAGHGVRIFDDCSRGSASRVSDISRDLEIINGDIRDAEAVGRAIAGVDVVCHLAYVNGTEFFYTKPAHVLDVGVKGMINVLDGCIKNDVRELVVASSSEVYQTPPHVPTDETAPLSVPDPFNPRFSYGGGKIISELMAINYGRQFFDRVVIFRPHNVFGPDMGTEHIVPQFALRLRELITSAGSEEIAFPIQGTGEQTRAFVYIDDFIEGLMLAIEKGEHLNIYNIGTMEELRVSDVAHRIAEYLGVRIRIVPGLAPEGGTLRRCPDISKLSALGYQPRFLFNEGLPPTIDWYVAKATAGSSARD